MPRARDPRLGGGRFSELARHASAVADAGDSVVAIDPVALRILPATTNLRGFPTTLAVALLFACLPMIAILKDAFVDRRLDASIVVPLGSAIGTLCVLAALLISADLATAAARPILFNRRLQRAYAMKGLLGKRSCEAPWADLIPCIETRAGFAGPKFRLYLVRRVAGSDRIELVFAITPWCESPERGAAVFEFIRRFMEDGMRDLPATNVRIAARLPLREQLRSGFFIGGISKAAAPWARTSVRGRALWSFVFLPVLWFVTYPLEFGASIGARLGPIARFPDAVERDARFESSRDGAIAPEIAARFAPQRRTAPNEFRADAISFTIASVLWCAFAAYVIFLFLNDPPHGFT